MRLQTYNGIALFDSGEERPHLNRHSDILADSSQSQVLPSIASVLTQIATEELSPTAHHQSISIDQWAIFPDGLHAIIVVRDQSADGHARSSKPRLLTSFIARFKAATAKRINLVRNQPGSPVWQRSYKEQLVQDELMLSRLKKQITNAKNVVASGSALSQMI